MPPGNHDYRIHPDYREVEPVIVQVDFPHYWGYFPEQEHERELGQQCMCLDCVAYWSQWPQSV